MAEEFHESVVGYSDKGQAKLCENASSSELLPESSNGKAVCLSGSPAQVSNANVGINVLGTASISEKETEEPCQILVRKDLKDSGKGLGFLEDLVVDTQKHRWQRCALMGEDKLPQVDFHEGNESGSSICGICLEKITVGEASLVKGCDHLYCITCILRWASYKADSWCPHCRLPFSSLYVHKSLDGSLNDFLVEESVCLLLRAPWFEAFPLVNESEEQEDYLDEDDCYDEYYYTSNVRLGNRRWGDNGYVRGGRKEARPVGVRHVPSISHASSIVCGSSTMSSKQKVLPKESGGRRAKRTQRREAADMEAASKPQGSQKQHQQLKGKRAQHC